MKKSINENTKKEERINIRCTEKEKRAINTSAEEADTTMSNYILSVLKRNDTIMSKEWVTDRVDLINTMNEIYRLVVESGDELLISQVRKLLP